MRIRWGAYAGVSTALAGGVIVKALFQRPNFYSAAVYLAQSSANLMILTNLIFVAACAFLVFLQTIFYGPLRPTEIEQLYDKAWFAVTETCLAMTIFRGEIGAWFLVMFFALLTGKVWGWIGEGRVEILEQQPPQNPRLFHTRLAASLILSVLFDTWMLEYVVKQVLHMARPDMMVMFGFEFGVLSILSLSTLARYGISLVEILIVRGQRYRRVEEIKKERREARELEQRAADNDQQIAAGGTQRPTTTGQPASTTPATLAVAIPDEPIDEAEIEVDGWQEKGRWIFYLDLTTDFFKLVIYLSFFFILLVFYGLPIHILRDVFLTCRSFFKRIADFLRYRTATRDMNERYPDATTEEVGPEDVCIICREDMRVTPRTGEVNGDVPRPQLHSSPVAERMRPKKLPCGHVLHLSCLRSWLERQQICPTCRRPVVSTNQTRAHAGAGGFRQGFADGVAAARVRGDGHAEQGQPRQGQGQPAGNANGQPGEMENPNRARVWQLGPLRIGVGAGRGDLFEDLAQRVHDGDAAPVQAQGGNAQQFGFGFGFARTNRRQDPRPSGAVTVQEQLDLAERQIQHEINSLRVSANELTVVRMLQAELTRLRGLRQGANVGTQSLAPSNGAGAGAHSAQAVPAQATGLVTHSRQNVLEAGSTALPEGLILPQGWSMMPLQRMQHGQPLPPMAFSQPGGSGVGHNHLPQAVVQGHVPDVPPANPSPPTLSTENPQVTTSQETARERLHQVRSESASPDTRIPTHDHDREAREAFEAHHQLHNAEVARHHHVADSAAGAPEDTRPLPYDDVPLMFRTATQLEQERLSRETPSGSMAPGFGAYNWTGNDPPVAMNSNHPVTGQPPATTARAPSSTQTAGTSEASRESQLSAASNDAGSTPQLPSWGSLVRPRPVPIDGGHDAGVGLASSPESSVNPANGASNETEPAAIGVMSGGRSQKPRAATVEDSGEDPE